ncbi:26 kDa periplasmic immunogenic protein precursor [Grimontia celer]|uniref:26 kDa periplasmic immunogenic protein n=1 Tax=Grimontia celer TaxID=1796497 RepID=A0A128FAF8_9GAMM|nr:oxidative stress defense protein [Grimontia celer]CZF83772.1 26 kDa periplasmic immunogenic protein precursor [Grimontia celer]
MKKHLIASLVGAAIALSSPFVSAATPDFPHLETIGVGEVVDQPDTATVDVAVSLTRTSAQAAKKASDDAVATLLERLEKMGIARKDIESANLNLQPQYSYPKNSEPKLNGYRATRNVTVTVSDLSRLNRVLDGALADGLNRVNGISFSSSKEAELKEQARMAAIADAKAKAESLAKGFGESLAGVWEIRYMTSTPVRPTMMRMAEASNVAASYNDAEITIRDQVEVVYALGE